MHLMLDGGLDNSWKFYGPVFSSQMQVLYFEATHSTEICFPKFRSNNIPLKGAHLEAVLIQRKIFSSKLLG